MCCLKNNHKINVHSSAILSALNSTWLNPLEALCAALLNRVLCWRWSRGGGDRALTRERHPGYRRLRTPPGARTGSAPGSSHPGSRFHGRSLERTVRCETVCAVYRTQPRESLWVNTKIPAGGRGAAEVEPRKFSCSLVCLLPTCPAEAWSLSSGAQGPPWSGLVCHLTYVGV